MAKAIASGEELKLYQCTCAVNVNVVIGWLPIVQLLMLEMQNTLLTACAFTLAFGSAYKFVDPTGNNVSALLNRRAFHVPPPDINTGGPLSRAQPNVWRGVLPRQPCPGMSAVRGPGGVAYCTAAVNGMCDERTGVCYCSESYSGIDCSACAPTFDINKTSGLCVHIPTCPSACSGRGVCVSPGVCSCAAGFVGADCSLSVCRALDRRCSTCTDDGVCLGCVEGYFVSATTRGRCIPCTVFDPRCTACDGSRCTACADPLLSSVRRSGRRRVDALGPSDEDSRRVGARGGANWSPAAFGSQDADAAFDSVEAFFPIDDEGEAIAAGVEAKPSTLYNACLATWRTAALSSLKLRGSTLMDDSAQSAWVTRALTAGTAARVVVDVHGGHGEAAERRYSIDCTLSPLRDWFYGLGALGGAAAESPLTPPSTGADDNDALHGWAGAGQYAPQPVELPPGLLWALPNGSSAPVLGSGTPMALQTALSWYADLLIPTHPERYEPLQNTTVDVADAGNAALVEALWRVAAEEAALQFPRAASASPVDASNDSAVLLLTQRRLMQPAADGSRGVGTPLAGTRMLGDMYLRGGSDEYRESAAVLLNASAFSCSQQRAGADGNAWSCTHMAISHVVCGTPGTVAFLSPTYAVVENEGGLFVRVGRTGGGVGRVTVRLSINFGIAGTPGMADAADASAPSGGNLLVFEVGVVQLSVWVPVHDDLFVEGQFGASKRATYGAGRGSDVAGDLNTMQWRSTLTEHEVFRLQLSHPTGGSSLGNDDVATIAIVDDDAGRMSPRWSSFNSTLQEECLARDDDARACNVDNASGDENYSISGTNATVTVFVRNAAGGQLPRISDVPLVMHVDTAAAGGPRDVVAAVGGRELIIATLHLQSTRRRTAVADDAGTASSYMSTAIAIAVDDVTETNGAYVAELPRTIAGSLHLTVQHAHPGGLRGDYYHLSDVDMSVWQGDFRHEGRVPSLSRVDAGINFKWGRDAIFTPVAAAAHCVMTDFTHNCSHLDGGTMGTVVPSPVSDSVYVKWTGIVRARVGGWFYVAVDTDGFFRLSVGNCVTIVRKRLQHPLRAVRRPWAASKCTAFDNSTSASSELGFAPSGITCTGIAACVPAKCASNVALSDATSHATTTRCRDVISDVGNVRRALPAHGMQRDFDRDHAGAATNGTMLTGALVWIPGAEGAVKLTLEYQQTHANCNDHINGAFCILLWASASAQNVNDTAGHPSTWSTDFKPIPASLLYSLRYLQDSPAEVFVHAGQAYAAGRRLNSSAVDVAAVTAFAAERMLPPLLASPFDWLSQMEATVVADVIANTPVRWDDGQSQRSGEPCYIENKGHDVSKAPRVCGISVSSPGFAANFVAGKEAMFDITSRDRWGNIRRTIDRVSGDASRLYVIAVALSLQPIPEIVTAESERTSFAVGSRASPAFLTRGVVSGTATVAAAANGATMQASFLFQAAGSYAVSVLLGESDGTATHVWGSPYWVDVGPGPLRMDATLLSAIALMGRAYSARNPIAFLVVPLDSFGNVLFAPDSPESYGPANNHDGSEHARSNRHRVSKNAGGRHSHVSPLPTLGVTLSHANISDITIVASVSLMAVSVCDFTGNTSAASWNAASVNWLYTADMHGLTVQAADCHLAVGGRLAAQNALNYHAPRLLAYLAVATPPVAGTYIAVASLGMGDSGGSVVDGTENTRRNAKPKSARWSVSPVLHPAAMVTVMVGIQELSH